MHHPVPYPRSVACSASSSSSSAPLPTPSSMPATYAPSWCSAVPSSSSAWPRSLLQLPTGTSSFHRVCASASALVSSTSLPSHSSQRCSHPQLAPGPSAAPIREAASVELSSPSCCAALFLRSAALRQCVLSPLSTLLEFGLLAGN